ncbi:M9 family metallopeptidase [Streptacidiphilus jiangxiensis]|uniref:microbial collagenase n=1 Tax=Streptacidiphilus jiangxiensis TaxID=235985 RepID=A0A1H7UKG8_STRJI|nr:M9 family metallopeptidase [Streptacidiphilus jiangxiensis]SEL97128.1 microbial collagenase [Streptacidiphilus jiangxiensis]
MRYRSTLPGILASGLAAAVAATGFLTPAASAATSSARVPFKGASSFAARAVPAAHVAASSAAAKAGRTRPGPLGRNTGGSDTPAQQAARTGAALLPPQTPPKPLTASHAGVHARLGTHAAAASCTAADFGSRSGAALVSFVEASSTDCVNTLFGLTGADAGKAFAEPQMITVADAFATSAASYTGDDSKGIWQLVLFLRAGYYVQFNNSAAVGPYDASLTSAVQRGMDAFFASPHAADVTAANGDVLGDVVVLTDSASDQAHYLTTYKKILGAFDPASYDATGTMTPAVNDVFTPLWRGNWVPAFVDAVTADPSILDTLDSFALDHTGLLGGDDSYVDANSGNDLARFVGQTALQAKARPLVKGLLDASSMTGPTAALWVPVASQANSYDAANCGYYGTCNLAAQLTAAVLPITHSCDATHTIVAQSLDDADLAAACTSVLNEDAFFHNVVKDDGPIPGQYENSVKLVVFASKSDYATYAGAIFGVDTDNGGITLTGDPTDPNNQPMSIMYIKSPDDGFVAGIWNLNHEYTHLLDGRYDMKGDFSAEVTVPDIWWIEGLAEYDSYTYRGITDDEAVTEAAKHTYALSTLFQSTYENSDVTRTYPWGYLAVRYMLEKHPQDVYAMLGHFRTGDYAGGYAVYNGVGTAYDADFDSWLTACAAGACNQPVTLPTCPDASPQAMGQNCSRSDQAEPAGDLDYFYLYLPAGTTTLTVSSTGGTGSASLYYDPDTWASPSTYTASSTNAGTAQSLTVTNTTAGYRYFSLYANTAFSGVTVSTRY